MAQTTIFDLLKNFLKDDTWFFTELPGGDTLRLGFEGENGQWSCYAMVREEQSQLIFYSYCPVKIPEGKRNVVAEYLTRANLGLVIGNFELDFNDGSIRFKTSSFIPPEDNELTRRFVYQVIYFNIMTMDKLLPGILQINYSDARPAEVPVGLDRD